LLNLCVTFLGNRALAAEFEPPDERLRQASLLHLSLGFGEVVGCPIILDLALILIENRKSGPRIAIARLPHRPRIDQVPPPIFEWKNSSLGAAGGRKSDSVKATLRCEHEAPLKVGVAENRHLHLEIP